MVDGGRSRKQDAWRLTRGAWAAAPLRVRNAVVDHDAGMDALPGVGAQQPIARPLAERPCLRLRPRPRQWLRQMASGFILTPCVQLERQA